MAELYHVDLKTDPRPGAPEPGFGTYASYHALWHLREIGVVPDLGSFDCPAWDKAEEHAANAPRPTRVALIDVSVAYKHPNLAQAVLADLMIDFFSARYGAFPCPASDSNPIEEALATAPQKAQLLDDENTRKLFRDLCASLGGEYAEARKHDWRAPLRVAPATSPAFSAHGTAMAGLIGARPRGSADVRIVATHHIGGDDKQPRPQPPEATGFPYAGVDPFCHVIPISTSFDPDPEQLIFAMLYAWLIDADVICLARDFPDPARAAAGDAAADVEAQLAAMPVDVSGETPLWDALAHLLTEISKRVPIVCAAGNGGDDRILYPASLAGDDNGIIAVGARAATGNRAGYSSTSPAGRQPSGVTVYAPSGDGERLDEDMQRLDTSDPEFDPRDHGSGYLGQMAVQHAAIEGARSPKRSPSVFATQEIITTDVPGAAGYNSSAFGRPTAGGGILDYRSYYCHFSGTSAATALAAGLVSLGKSTGVLDGKSPMEIKRMLRGAADATDDVACTPFLSWSALSGPR